MLDLRDSFDVFMLGVAAGLALGIVVVAALVAIVN